jgi:hypothetical protein
MNPQLQYMFVAVIAIVAVGRVVAGDADDEEIARLVKQLGNGDFRKRNEASKQLSAIGKPGLRALRKAATDTIDPELRSRATELIQAIEDSLVHCIDLGPYVNQKLHEPFHDSFPGNDLAILPTGTQIFAGIKFTVGGGVVQLGSPRHPGGLEKVEAIKVGTKTVKLHFLHACGRSAGTRAGTRVATYVLHYDDNSTTEVEIVYGKDVVDWWEQRGVADPSRSKVAWEGQNDAMRANGLKIKLFLTTWQNPHPNKLIRTIDYLRTGDRQQTGAAPFCVAISAEK